jgi:hypothetical protein
MGALKEHGDLVCKINLIWGLWSECFSRVHNVVTRQMQNKFPPHLEAIHCMVHCTNLIVQTLFQIPIVKFI